MTRNIKILKISAVDLETMLFPCISIKKYPNLVKLSLSRLAGMENETVHIPRIRRIKHGDCRE
jgi:hypothetical protein